MLFTFKFARNMPYPSFVYVVLQYYQYVYFRLGTTTPTMLLQAMHAELFSVAPVDGAASWSALSADTFKCLVRAAAGRMTAAVKAYEPRLALLLYNTASGRGERRRLIPWIINLL